MRITDLPHVSGVSHRSVQLGGVRIHLAEGGEGTPLVLLHGWPQHWWCWRRLMPRLAQRHRVLAPDLRGFGWSDAPPGDYSQPALAADVLALLDSEGLDRVRLVGHDWGGYIAFLLALDHPDRVENVTAMDIAPPWSSPGWPRPRHLGLPLFASYQAVLATPVVGPAALTRSDRFVRTILSAGSGPDAVWTDDEVGAYANVLREPDRARASSALYRSFLTRELPGRVARGGRHGELRVPSLLVMGGASPLHRILQPRPLPNLKVQVVPRAGHFLPEEAPDEVLRLLA